MKTGTKRGFFLAVCLIVLLFAFPAKVRAENGFECVELYYYAFDETGAAYFDSENFCFYGSFTEEQKAVILFENLFDNNDAEKIGFVPAGTELIGAEIDGDVLIINVTGDIKNYGGTAYEKALLKQLALNALNFEGVEKLTLMIDGGYELLPEGKFIFEYEIGEILNEF